ncbi:MAG: glycosyltransferase family 2 protein [Defluviitaleaceae bacterium]|nr:glycosyltransferase family 2 protein [Defluviitaleaceae bacterium]
MILYIVIPCYNEEEALPISSGVISEKVRALIAAGTISDKSRIMLVDDGSRDKTWEVITRLHGENNLITGVKLTRNRGHQNALLAGLITAKDYCDAAVSIDADLQDDINAIDGMIEKYKTGCDVVYGIRSSREKDTFFKRNTALVFYKIMKKMGVDMVYNHADYRLMSKRALEGLEQFEEVNLFLRGIVPLIGYKHDFEEYGRGERVAGESKYPLSKMIAFAIQGITSMSIKPIRMITTLGLFIFVASFVLLVYSLVMRFIGNVVPGWTSLMWSIWALGGLQMLSLGIIGEYVGKIYLEAKKRPKFIIEEFLKN